MSVSEKLWLCAVPEKDKDPEPCIEIKDSKKCTEKHRLKCYDYIIENSKAYSIQLIDHEILFRNQKQ